MERYIHVFIYICIYIHVSICLYIYIISPNKAQCLLIVPSRLYWVAPGSNSLHGSKAGTSSGLLLMNLISVGTVGI